jgi:hypothetical protein
MKTVVRSILIVVFTAITATLMAQKPKPAPAAAKQTQKFKPPKLTTVLGIHADSATVFVEEALQLVNIPLKITDDKKNPYSISSYQVMYKRTGVTEVEENGSVRVVPATNSVVQLFRETPMSGIWKKTITEQIKPGDELYFFDVIVKDTQGRFMFAPELRIKVR